MSEGPLVGYYQGNFYSISHMYQLGLLSNEDVTEIMTEKINVPNIYNQDK